MKLMASESTGFLGQFPSSAPDPDGLFEMAFTYRTCASRRVVHRLSHSSAVMTIKQIIITVKQKDLPGYSNCQWLQLLKMAARTSRTSASFKQVTKLIKRVIFSMYFRCLGYMYLCRCGNAWMKLVFHNVKYLRGVLTDYEQIYQV